MDAKQLRIGNYVYAFGTVWQVDNTCFKSIERLETYKPIPLTEEWAIKLGFDKCDGRNYIKEIGEYTLRLWFHEDDVYFYIINGFRKQIKYAHELQNIVYSLFDKELELK
jgi:hypothetical protein